jgi:hypothetical protein
MNKPIVGVKIPICRFDFAPRWIVYCPFLGRHKDEIKIKILQYNLIEYICPIFVLLIDPDHLDEITMEKPKLWANWICNNLK